MTVVARLVWSGRPAASYVKARVSAAVVEPSRYAATDVRAPSPSQVVAVRSFSVAVPGPW